ncbi:methyltransferase domain-containing protein [Hyphococcus formosus]|uniref:class I SAM-dependent methyltransferase n=1 Tax=Hyphococcus formosus TaxID=3143534 RepID=UPI00398B18B5
MHYPIDRPMTRQGIEKGYWELRKDRNLYKTMNLMARHYAANAKSAIDVGSYIGGFICDLDWIPERLATDINNYEKQWSEVQGVTFKKADAFKLERKFDLVISNQTIEHIPDARAFAEKLCSLGPTVMVSTTYQVPHGRVEGHIHDPIDMDQFLSWFPRKPKFAAIVDDVPFDNIFGVF